MEYFPRISLIRRNILNTNGWLNDTVIDQKMAQLRLNGTAFAIFGCQLAYAELTVQEDLSKVKVS